MRHIFSGLAVSALVCGVAASAQPEMKPNFVPIDAAHAGTVAAITTCQKMSHLVAAVVVDAKGNARLTIVMDDAYFLAGNIAMDKAKIAALSGKATNDSATPSRSERSTSETTRKAINDAVGLPVIGPDGQLVGALGVAGAGSAEDNLVCARAELEAIKGQLK